MTAHYQVHGATAVITLDNPPVNGLGHATRTAILAGVERAVADATVQAIVITGAGKAFSGGADIREFNTPAALAEPALPNLIAAIESAAKPVVAAVHSIALGGGNELALGCHYRVGSAGAQIGLPEVKLGVLPGAGGTQRLPRLIGVPDALEMIVTGNARQSEAMAKLGYFDRLVTGDLLAGALQFATEIVAAGAARPHLSERTIAPESLPGGATAFFAAARQKVAAESRGFPAPLKCVDAVEAAVLKPFAEGLAFERSLFKELVASTASKALRHVFFSERAAARIPDIAEDQALRAVQRAGVIGAGIMGGGIAMSFVNAGIPVVLLEVQQEALDRGLGVIRANYESSAKKGKLTPAQVEQRMGLIQPTLDYADLAQVDIVIEAVFENLDVKAKVFRQLDATLKPGAILASNTSMLDINKIAAFTNRPQDVIGTHFFSPANVMRLLEIVRGAATGKDVLATTMRLSKKLGKVGVVSGVCDGFIGNRMVEQYIRQATFMVDAGATPQQVDAALENWGMAMGVFRMLDMAGLDTSWSVRKRRYVEMPQLRYSKWMDRVCELGRYGLKNGAGIYQYAKGSRTPAPDPVIEQLIRDYAREMAIPQRTFSDEEIVGRCIYALVNEAAHILAEGIAQRASDVDVVYLTGYGFPAYRGGPMFYADTVGLPAVVAAMAGYAKEAHGDPAFWEPAPLLARLAAEQKKFS